jgi:YfiR/HmsC-like
MLICMLSVLVCLPALAAEFEASAVKAAFLHRFAAYVQWPTASVNPDAPFMIAVLDDVTVVGHLERLLPGLTIHDRRAQVLSISNIDEARDAQILYIGGAHAGRAQALTNALKGQPILVVTSHDTGLADGAAINFVQVGRNVRFEVSLPAARANALQINSGLLSVAVRVEDEPRAGSEGPKQIFLAQAPWKKITRRG